MTGFEPAFSIPLRMSTFEASLDTWAYVAHLTGLEPACDPVTFHLARNQEGYRWLIHILFTTESFQSQQRSGKKVSISYTA